MSILLKVIVERSDLQGKAVKIFKTKEQIKFD